MPQIAQRLREPAAFALLAYAALASLLHTIDFLFEPGAPCMNSVCNTTPFADRAAGAVSTLASPVVAAALVGAVYLAHLGTQIKQAKLVTLIALGAGALASLFALIALFASFGADGSGWDKIENFLIGAAELAVFGIATWLVYGWYQQHAAVKPVAPAFGGPAQQQFDQPQQQFQPQGQWGQPQQAQPQAAPPQGQGQWQPPAPAPQQPPQQWAPQPPPSPAQPQPQQGQPWGAPPPPPQQQGFGGETSDSMMTQAIPSVPKPQAAPPAPPTHHQQQQNPETQQFPPVGNWTSE